MEDLLEFDLFILVLRSSLQVRVWRHLPEECFVSQQKKCSNILTVTQNTQAFFGSATIVVPPGAPFLESSENFSA